MSRSLCTFILFLFFSFNNNSINDVRIQYKLALTQESAVEALEKSTAPLIKTHASMQAFYGTALALKARNSTWVSTKLSLAQKASYHLNESVKKLPNNTEIRFLRFSFESKVPSFLGLNAHIEEDKKFLISYINSDEPLWSIMKDFFHQSSVLSAAEKKSLTAR